MLLLPILLLGCQKDIGSENEKGNEQTRYSKTMSEDSNPFSKLTENEKDIIKENLFNILDASTYIISKIANSDITNEDLDSISNENILRYGIFTQQELEEKINSIKNSSAIIKNLIEITPCSDCSSDGEINELRQLIRLYRVNSSAFISFKQSFQAVRLFDTDPNCSWGFYACLIGCTALTDGIGAVACVYVCACSFCELKPPGC